MNAIDIALGSENRDDAARFVRATFEGDQRKID